MKKQFSVSTAKKRKNVKNSVKALCLFYCCCHSLATRFAAGYCRCCCCFQYMLQCWACLIFGLTKVKYSGSLSFCPSLTKPFFPRWFFISLYKRGHQQLTTGANEKQRHFFPLKKCPNYFVACPIGINWVALGNCKEEIQRKHTRKAKTNINLVITDSY